MANTFNQFVDMLVAQKNIWFTPGTDQKKASGMADQVRQMALDAGYDVVALEEEANRRVTGKSTEWEYALPYFSHLNFKNAPGAKEQIMTQAQAGNAGQSGGGGVLNGVPIDPSGGGAGINFNAIVNVGIFLVIMSFMTAIFKRK